ncbi:hypothetical protein F3Y22_tig00112226pilonHSYRG00073 [Hibiscus syriacus]|uniref:Uncharacterized protein n=1 Tax=Hibiscus syriacus TaxID=106335 RepID=A0A6A2XIK4_HIBSY|nr:hypothetical protein F3Y22_tig00112226pilonHSYRG00073 [Hibiscus syriacus]
MQGGPSPVWPSDRSEERGSVSHRTPSGDSPHSHGVDGWRWSFWSLRLGRGSGGDSESRCDGRVALGYYTLGFAAGTIWTVGSCQIQRQQAEAAGKMETLIC